MEKSAFILPRIQKIKLEENFTKVKNMFTK